MRRVNTKVDGNVRDAFVFARNTVGFVLYFFPNSNKIGKNTTLAVDEFCILCQTEITSYVHSTSQETFDI